MVKIKFALLICTSVFVSFHLHAQDENRLDIETCYRLAQAHYPVLQQDHLLQEQLDIALKNINSHYLPQASLQGQATYQSDVTSIPVKIPGMDIPEAAKDQYRATLHLQQLIYDGGNTKRQKQIQKTQNNISIQRQAITFHQLKIQLNKLYAGILLTKARINAVRTRQSGLGKQLQLAEASVKNGVALPSHADELRVALLQGSQQLNALQADRRAGIRALSLITGKTLSDSILLVLPQKINIDLKQEIERPELRQFALQTKLLGHQSSLLDAGSRPQISLFADGGYGRPGLNMLNDHFDWFYMAGIQLQWHLWDWNKKKRQQHILKLDAKKIELQKENFLLQTETALSRALSKIQMLEENIQKDEQITRLRKKISKTAASQLVHGTITPTEYLIKLNNETAAQIQQQSRLIQLRFAQLDYQLLKNK